MKIRTDFVTNSSSSSFTAVIEVNLVNGKEFFYTLNPVDYCDDDIGPVGLNISASNKVLQVSSINELCEALENAAVNYTTEERMMTLAEYIEEIENGISEEDYDMTGLCFEDAKYHYENTLKEKKKFSNKIKRACSSLDDIATVLISKKRENTGECCRCDAINDPVLVKLAKKVVELTGEEKKKAISEFLEFIKKSDYYVLIDEDRVESVAGELASCSSPLTEYISDISEIDIRNKKVKKYRRYYL